MRKNVSPPRGHRAELLRELRSRVAGLSAVQVVVVVGAHDRRPTRPAAPRRRPHTQLRHRIHRFAAAAEVDPQLAAACCQARAISSLLHQQARQGTWLDLEILTQLVLAAS